LAAQGLGADVVSEGELRRALAADIAANKIVFSGVGKARSEMKFALQMGILQFNVESERELLVLNDIAASLNLKAPIALRVNPDVDAKTHAKISTGRFDNKFGVPISRARDIYRWASGLQGLQITGVDMHIGSQITDLQPFDDATRLLMGKAVNPDKSAIENPVAWTTRTQAGGRAFTTTLGHPEDFAVEAVQRLCINSIH